MKALNLRLHKGVAANSGLREEVGAGSYRDLFCIVSRNVLQKSIMFPHHVNNIEHNIKQIIYTGMELISFIAPDTVYKNSKNENVLINNINKL